MLSRMSGPASDPVQLSRNGRAQRVARWLRVSLVVALIALSVWFLSKFGTRWVPAGMVTMPSVPPGSWCIVDRWSSGLRVGSDVFIETPLGEVVSRVVELDAEQVVIEHPNPRSGWLDSRDFGALPRANVRATIVVTFAPEGRRDGR